MISKERHKRGDDPLHDVVVNRCECNSDPFFFRGATLREGYMDIRLEVHVHFLARVNRLGGKAEHLCVLFHGHTSDHDGAPTQSPVLFDSGSDYYSCACCVKDDGMQESMLVDVGEFVKLPEGVRSKLIPSVIRLQTFDDCLRGGVNTSNVVPLGLKPGPVSKNRELGIFGNTVCERDGEFLSEGICNVVETTSQPVESVADDYAKRIKRDGISACDHDIITWFRVGLGDDSVMVTIEPFANLDFEFFEVFCRPIELK